MPSTARSRRVLRAVLRNRRRRFGTREGFRGFAENRGLLTIARGDGRQEGDEIWFPLGMMWCGMVSVWPSGKQSADQLMGGCTVTHSIA